MSYAVLRRFARLTSILVVSCAPGGCGPEPTNFSAPPASLELPSFFQKYGDASGVSVVTSEEVEDADIERAVTVVTSLLRSLRPGFHESLADAGLVVALYSPRSESVLDVPGVAEDPPESEAVGLYLRVHRRAVAPAFRKVCGASVAGDYSGDILVHELSHAIEAVFHVVDAELPGKLTSAYNFAVEKGDIWMSDYASTNPREYWAESVRNLFLYPFARQAVNEVDPGIAALLKLVFLDMNVGSPCVTLHTQIDIHWEPRMMEAQVAAQEVTLREGGCEGAAIRTIIGTNPLSLIGDDGGIASGQYGVEVLFRNHNCGRFAWDCIEVDTTVEGDSAHVVKPEPLPEIDPACDEDEICTSGICTS